MADLFTGRYPPRFRDEADASRYLRLMRPTWFTPFKRQQLGEYIAELRADGKIGRGTIFKTEGRNDRRGEGG